VWPLGQHLVDQRAAVLLAISAAFGGLKKAGTETPHVDAGTAIDAGQFEVTVQRVVTVKDLKPLFTPNDGAVLIAVVTKLKVTDATGTTPPSEGLVSRGLAGQPPAKGGSASTRAPCRSGVAGSARSPSRRKVQIDSTRASSGRSAETVVTRSRIEPASAIAEDSPAAERAAAKYLMVTSGIWSEPH
jgi:hypothetical protein